MERYIAEASITNGRLELCDIPFADNAMVKVIVIPKANLSKMSFPEIWNATQSITGNIADDVAHERGTR